MTAAFTKKLLPSPNQTHAGVPKFRNEAELCARFLGERQPTRSSVPIQAIFNRFRRDQPPTWIAISEPRRVPLLARQQCLHLAPLAASFRVAACTGRFTRTCLSHSACSHLMSISRGTSAKISDAIDDKKCRWKGTAGQASEVAPETYPILCRVPLLARQQCLHLAPLAASFSVAVCTGRFTHKCLSHSACSHLISISRVRVRRSQMQSTTRSADRNTLLDKPASGTRNTSDSPPSSSTNLRVLCGEYGSSHLRKSVKSADPSPRFSFLFRLLKSSHPFVQDAF